MATPIIKMYAKHKIPTFEAFEATPKYKHKDELWREEFKMGMSALGKDEHIPIDMRPTPFIFMGEVTIDPKSKALIFDKIFEKFSNRLIDKGYVRQARIVKAGVLDYDFRTQCHLTQWSKSEHGTKVKYRMAIEWPRMMAIMNKAAILENQPLDPNALKEAAANQQLIGEVNIDRLKSVYDQKADYTSMTLPDPNPEYLPQASPSMKKNSSRMHGVVVESKGIAGLFDYYEVNYSIAGMSTYIDTAIPILNELHNKITNYGLVFERPVDIPLQIKRLKKLKVEILSVAEKALLFGRSTNPGGLKKSHIINMKFDFDFKFRDFKLDKVRHPESPIKPFEPFDHKNKLEKYVVARVPPLTQEEVEILLRDSTLARHPLFSNQTTNSLIVYLKEIYTKYHLLPGQKFRNPDDLVLFLRKYVWPGPTFTNFQVTKDAIETFLLGDIRLLDDNFYKKSRPSRAAISEKARHEVRNAVATQYEKIGDALGDKFIQGEFENIDDLDDLYESVLNNISIPRLVRMSAGCLLQSIGLDELKRQFCKDAIKKYRNYQDAIVASVGSGGARGKYVAGKLRDAFAALDSQTQTAVGLTANYSMTQITAAVQESRRTNTWRKKAATKLFISSISKQREIKKALLTKKDSTFVNPNLDTKIVDKTRRIQDLQALILEQNERETLLGDKLPGNEIGLIQQYEAEIDKLEEDIDALNQTQTSAKLHIETYEYLLKTVIPLLVELNPFYKAKITDGWTGFVEKILGADNANGSAMAAFLAEAPYMGEKEGYTGDFQRYGVTKPTIENLGTINVQIWKAAPVKDRKRIFNHVLLPVIQDILHNLEEMENSLGTQVKEAFQVGLQEEGAYQLDTILNDPEDGLLVCAAVFAVVPAALYGLYVLSSNFEETAKALGQDIDKIGKAFKKRVEIFLNFEFPVNDLLEGLKEAAYDLGMNIARDLIISGIMYLAQEMLSMCDDKANSPYQPIGQIDLSEFVAASNINGASNVKESRGFTKISAKTGLTLAEYQRLLKDISNTFTINEMCALLQDAASFNLYTKFLHLLQSLEYLKGTTFYEYYVSEDGIHTFLKIIAADINPEFFVIAKNTFEKQKRMLLNICGATNEDIKRLELSDFMSPEELLKAMANAEAHRRGLVMRAIENVGAIIGGPITPAQLCGPKEEGAEGKINPYHPSQKFVNTQAADAIFGGLENIFEMEIGRVKDIYRDEINVVQPNAHGSFVPNYSPNIIPSPLPDDPTKAQSAQAAAFQSSLQDFSQKTHSGYAAHSIVEGLHSVLNPAEGETKNAFFTLLDKNILFDFTPDLLVGGGNINKKITFIYANESFKIDPQYAGASITPELLTKLITLGANPTIALSGPYADPAKIDWSLEEYQAFGEEIRKQISVFSADNIRMPGTWSNHKMAYVYTYTSLYMLYGRTPAYKNQPGISDSPQGFTDNLKKWYPSKSTAAAALIGYDDILDLNEFKQLVAIWESYSEWLGPSAHILAGGGPSGATADSTYDPTVDYASLKSRLKQIEEEAEEALNEAEKAAYCKYVRLESDTWDLATQEKAALTAVEAAAAGSEIEILAAQQEIDIYFKPGMDAQLVLQVQQTPTGNIDPAADLTIFSYATKKPAIIENFSENYALYSGLPTDTEEKLKTFIRNQDLYILALNEVFQDLLISTSRNGLYLDAPQPASSPTVDPYLQMFSKLHLKKHLPITAAGKCFLGFFNKRVLNSQVQKLSEALNCYSPMSVSKSSTNLAYIKVSLDCLIRTVVVKELMKCLFIFGFTALEGLYSYQTTDPDAPEPFFSLYLNEEIERALQKQFEMIAGGSIDNFYADIIEEFIRGLMRILYEDETMTSKAAYNILIRDQVNFVKNVLNSGMPEELRNSPGHFDKKLLQQVMVQELPIVKVGDEIPETEELSAADLYLSGLDEIEHADQLRVLQNDQFTHYLNTMNPASINLADAPIDGYRIFESGQSEANTGIVYPRTTTQLVFNTYETDEEEIPTYSQNQFTLRRSHSEELRNFSLFPPTQAETANLKDALGGVNSGFATEKLVEINYNKSFFTKMTENQKRRLSYEMAMWEQCLGETSLAGAVDSEGGGSLQQNTLRQFLYETKLIMLFPQARPFVEDPSLKRASDKLYTEYLANTIQTAGTGGRKGRWEQLTEKAETYGVFWRLFRYNFDEDYTDEDRIELMKLWPNLDWGLTGKIYINDFEALIGSFRYPFDNTDFYPEGFTKGANTDTFKKEYVDGFALNTLDKWVPRPYYLEGAKDISEVVDEASAALYDAFEEQNLPAEAATQRLYTLLANSFGDNALGALKDDGYYSYLPLSTKTKLAGLATAGKIPSEIQTNFFTWLYTLPISDIFDIKFITRIAQYISHIDKPDIQTTFDWSNLGADKALSQEGSGESGATKALQLLKEKMGKVDFLSNAGTNEEVIHKYVTFPIYTLDLPLPQDWGTGTAITWFDFMLKIYKKSITSEAKHYAPPTFNNFFSDGGSANTANNPAAIKLEPEDWTTLSEAFSNKINKQTLDVEYPWIGAAMWGTDSVAGPLSGYEPGKGGEKVGPTNDPYFIRKIDWNQLKQWGVDAGSTIRAKTGVADKWTKATAGIFGAGATAAKRRGAAGIEQNWKQGLIYQYSIAWDDRKFGITFNKVSYKNIEEGIEDGSWTRHGTQYAGDLKTKGWASEECFKIKGNLQKSSKNLLEAFTQSYMKALNETIYSADLAQPFLYKIAPGIIAHFLSQGSDGLKKWIGERIDWIEVSDGNVYPWNPAYDFTDPGWVSTRVLQDFLYQLQLSTYGKDAFNSYGFTGYDTNPKGPGAPMTWTDSLSWVAQEPTMGAPIDSPPAYLAELFGFKDVDGNLVDILGDHRVFPYEYNVPAFGEVATLSNVLFNPVEPKKDIYTMVTKFAADDIPPENFMGKMIQELPPYLAEDSAEPSQADFKKLMQSFFIREQTTILTLMHRMLVEKYYPEIEDNFNATLAASAETLLTSIAVANGDYQRTAPTTGPPMGGFDFGSLGMGILKAFMGAMANTCDPTWKTPWPWNWPPGIGPLTPIGVAAKLLNAYNPDFSSATNMRKEAQKRTVCDATVDQQASLIKYGSLLDKPPGSQPDDTG